MSYTEGSALAHGPLGADSPSADQSFKEVLWRSANGPDVKPTYPIYSAATRRCIFVGEEAKGMALYSVQQGKAGPAK